MATTRRGRPAGVTGLAVIAGTVGIGAVALAGVTRPFTDPGDAVVAAAVALLLSIVVAQGRAPLPPFLRRRSTAPGGGGVTPWIVIAAIAIGWELFCWSRSPRRDHPTLSYLLGLITVHDAGRALVFLAWLVLGWAVITQ